MSHATPPWQNAELGKIITKESMKAYFSTQVAQ